MTELPFGEYVYLISSTSMQKENPVANFVRPIQIRCSKYKFAERSHNFLIKRNPKNAKNCNRAKQYQKKNGLTVPPFCATDLYRATGIRYWIFLLHGCRTNQINIFSPKGGSVKPFLVLFCFVAIFCIFRISFDTERNSKTDFPLAQVWSLSRSQRSPKISCIGNCIKRLWLRSANLYFVQRIFIGRAEFATGFSFWMSN